MADDPVQTVCDNLEKPKKGQNNMGMFEQQSLADQIEAAKFIAAENTKSGKFKGMGVSKFGMPSTQ